MTETQSIKILHLLYHRYQTIIKKTTVNNSSRNQEWYYSEIKSTALALFKNDQSASFILLKSRHDIMDQFSQWQVDTYIAPSIFLIKGT